MLEELNLKHQAYQWKSRGVHVWPFIRQKLAWELIGAEKRGSVKANVSGRLKLFIIALRELFVFLFRSRHVDIVFLTKSTYRSKFQEYYYDKFCDSIIHLSKDNLAKKSVILESGVNFSYRRPAPPGAPIVTIQGLLYLVRLLADLCFLFQKKKSVEQRYTALRADVSAMLATQVRFSDRDALKYLNRLIFQSFIFHWFLKRSKPKATLMVCYYEDFGYAMNIAAQKLNIKSIDIQHGVQGPFHPAYAPSAVIPEGGFEMIPDVFWVWNKQSADNIERWGSKFHRCFVGGNPWIDFCQAHDDHSQSVRQGVPTILVSLQPVEDPLPHFLMNAMVESRHSYRWLLRLHPRQMADVAIIAERLKSYGLIDDVEMDQASSLPLPLLLKETNVHITQWSSVVIEAYEFGVPSIVIHETGQLLYDGEDFQDFMRLALSTQEILDSIAKFLSLNLKSDVVRSLDQYDNILQSIE